LSIRARLSRLYFTNLADLGSKLRDVSKNANSTVIVTADLDVLLRTALDLLLGRHIDCELVFDWRIRGGVDRVVELSVGNYH
jgi:hypothetical protein